LSTYDLLFYNGNIDTDYIEAIRLTDINQIKNSIQLDGYNFTDLTSREQLYLNMTSILRNAILLTD